MTRCHIDQVDLVGNDSGGGICQIFAALNPDRVRTLTLTNCDTQDNWPPEAFKPFVEMVAAGGLSKTLNAMLGDKSMYRSPGVLGPAYEHPEAVRDEDIEICLRQHLRNEQRIHDLERFVRAFDNKHTLAIEPPPRSTGRSPPNGPKIRPATDARCLAYHNALSIDRLTGIVFDLCKPYLSRGSHGSSLNE